MYWRASRNNSDTSWSSLKIHSFKIWCGSRGNTCFKRIFRFPVPRPKQWPRKQPTLKTSLTSNKEKKTKKPSELKTHNTFGFHMAALLETGCQLSSQSSEQIMFYTGWAELNVFWPKASSALQTTVPTVERLLCHPGAVTSNGLYKDINT